MRRKRSNEDANSLLRLMKGTFTNGLCRIKTDMKTLSRSFLDQTAIALAVICGIHCLVTPILLVGLPLLATTFWVDENFHLWMLLLVIPTTALAMGSGCRRHKDKWVLALASVGIGFLIVALVTERATNGHSEASLRQGSVAEVAAGGGSDNQSGVHAAGGGCCALHPVEGSGADDASALPAVPWHVGLNTLGGFFLVMGHTRNFLLCRRSDCGEGLAAQC